ncbi:MAG: sugar-binding transcriptional regulator [Acidimicrobiales bacterium]
MPDDDRLEFLGQVAAWYFEDGLDQTEIGRRIGRSRSMVSRLLQEARDNGLVQIRVSYPLRTDNDLERRLVDRFDLTEARVLLGDHLDHESMLRPLGRLGAIALQRRLHSGVNVTVGWGAALHAVVRAMPDIELDGVMVLQAMGSIGGSDPSVDGSDLARTLASRLNGDFRFLPAPHIVSSVEAARSLLADRTIAGTLALAARAEVAIMGIGSIDSEHSGLVRAGYFDEAHLARLRRAGVVGDFMGHCIDADGQVLDIEENRKVVGLRPDELGGIGTVIGVAGGIDKAPAILATLRAGRLDVIVTDAAASSTLLAIDRPSNHMLKEGA